MLPNNLPAQVSSFIGREAELAAVRALVGRSRLVTLTGAGGAGKTRLALQVAAGVLDGAGDGVWFADLAPLGDPGLVAVIVADGLGVRQEPGRPVLGTLVAAVSDRSLLVLLDNCEHLIGACAKLADALLRGCPNLALLATRARTAASSASRPMKLDTCAGRLVSSPGPSSDRSAGSPVGRPSACSWKICSGRPRSASRCQPRSFRPTPAGSASATSPAAAADTSTCPPCATAAIRAARCACGPVGSAVVAEASPLSMPIRARTVSPAGQACDASARCAWIAASAQARGEANTAQNSSPRAPTSSPP